MRRKSIKARGEEEKRKKQENTRRQHFSRSDRIDIYACMQRTGKRSKMSGYIVVDDAQCRGGSCCCIFDPVPSTYGGASPPPPNIEIPPLGRLVPYLRYPCPLEHRRFGRACPLLPRRVSGCFLVSTSQHGSTNYVVARSSCGSLFFDGLSPRGAATVLRKFFFCRQQ